MSDFLTHLVMRGIERQADVQPRLASRYEPVRIQELGPAVLPPSMPLELEPMGADASDAQREAEVYEDEGMSETDRALLWSQTPSSPTLHQNRSPYREAPEAQTAPTRFEPHLPLIKHPLGEAAEWADSLSHRWFEIAPNETVPQPTERRVVKPSAPDHSVETSDAIPLRPSHAAHESVSQWREPLRSSVPTDAIEPQLIQARALDAVAFESNRPSPRPAIPISERVMPVNIAAATREQARAHLASADKHESGAPRETAAPRLIVPHIQSAAPIHQTASSRAEPALQTNAPTVQVTIGRVEVRATPPAPPTASKAAPRRPALSLDDYLRQRTHGGAR